MKRKLKLARKLTTPAEVFKRLAQDPHWMVREVVAQNEKTPVEVLERLTEDEIWVVRREVAANKRTPVHILERLARDANEWVRQAVARNPNTPTEILNQLMRDEASGVRYAVARVLVERLEELPENPALWLAIWEATNRNGRARIKKHPYGQMVVALGGLANPGAIGK